ncbi:MAG TPA: AI-2E family transporter [Chloroflexia bacterium]|nr:AI-2E family transporter [Chloroflexia bacterium]
MASNNATGTEGAVTEQQTEVPVEQQGVSIQIKPNDTPALRIALGTIAVLGVLLLAFMVYKSLSVLLLLFIALLFATAIEPLVMRLRRGPFSRSTGTLVVYSVLFLIIGVIGYVLVSVFVSQLGDFSTALAKSIDDAKAGVGNIGSKFLRDQANILLDVAGKFVSQANDTPANNEQTAEAVTMATLTIVEVFFAIITVFVVAFYWLSERTLIKRSLMTWLPTSRANRVHRVWDDVELKVGGWVRGQLTLMVIVGVVSAVGYFVLGIKYWPALALCIFIAEAIPLVGPYIGTAPAVLVALTQTSNDGLPALIGLDTFSPLLRALLVVLFAVILQTVEGNVLIPRVMKDSVGISPLTVIISILLGATLAGLAGALVAVPIAAALQVILQDIKAAHVSSAKDASAEAIVATEDKTVTVGYAPTPTAES